MNNNLKTHINNIKEIKLDKVIQGFLERKNYENYDVQNIDIETNEDINFFKISHISYDRNKTETDTNLIDFQQLLSAVSSKNKKFIYMIESSQSGIDLYIGSPKEHENDDFLKNTFEGIYSGSTVLDNNIQPSFSKEMKHSKAMIGIPALKRDSDKEYKQSLEKVLFPMQGKNFRIVLVAQSYDLQTIQDIISNYQTLGSELHRFVKQSRNEQESHADSEGVTLTSGTSFSETENPTLLKDGSEFLKDVFSLINLGWDSIQENFIEAMFDSDTSKKRNHASLNEKDIIANTMYKVGGRTNSTNESRSSNKNTTKTDTLGITFDEINKSAEYCENLIDTYIERFQKGLNHGMWNSSLYIQAEDKIVLSELEHTLKSVYSGDESYYESIRFSDDLDKNQNIDISKLPMLYFDKDISHPIHPSFVGFSSAINTEELSILSALPTNDIEGISVSKISSFGLTQSKSIDKYNSIEIGVVLNKKKATNQRFKLSAEALNSHLFVSGITGSGKSNTIKHILNQFQSEDIEHKIPFLVIEPAKSEYKYLIEKIPNLQIFRPGAKNDIFKFNPFVFEHSRKNKSVTLTKHVDMLKTTFSSAFPMYGPMPYILEDAIHQIYKDKGWNFITEDNPNFTDSTGADQDRKSLLFPNMEDLRDKIETVVAESGYTGELDSNIKAALKTRINNLTIGIKGRIFNSRHTFDSHILFERPTIIELSSISDDDEKSFLMGLLLNKLYQYREECGQSERLRHITVIEEAHRLLPNISFQNGEEANSKGKAVETFTNILAEIRSYGEGIIIADQIASKLHADVIKNTNIKIIQRTMDKEDRELVGNSINLNEDQLLDIAELKAGEAIVHNKDIHQAFMVRIDKIKTEKLEELVFEKFNRKFLEKHEILKYEFIDEDKFYMDAKERLSIYSLNKESLKTPILNLLNAVLVNDKNIVKEWNNFKNILPKQKDKNIYFYLFINAFSTLNYISNIQYYKSIDKFLSMYKSLLRLVYELINENKINDAIKEVKITFLNKNIIEVYPSMKYFSFDDIDYTLLLLENMTTNQSINQFINNTMQEDISFTKKYDKSLIKIFNKTSWQLRYSLGAIRFGTDTIDLNKIVKEGV